MAGEVGVSLSPVVSAPTCAVAEAVTEQHMIWADAMQGNATVASRDIDSIADGSAREGVSDSWDPYNVWLTRVKQPRDRADANSDKSTGERYER